MCLWAATKWMTIFAYNDNITKGSHVWRSINFIIGFGFHIWWVIESKVKIIYLSLYSFSCILIVLVWISAVVLCLIPKSSQFTLRDVHVHASSLTSVVLIYQQITTVMPYHLYSFSTALKLLVLTLLFYWSIDSIFSDKVVSYTLRFHSCKILNFSYFGFKYFVFFRLIIIVLLMFFFICYQGDENVGVALLTYPVLMASDILLYQVNYWQLI